MGKVWVIFRREYLTRLRSHYFIVMTLLMPLFYGVFEVGRAQLKANYAERVVVKQRLAIVGYDGDRRLYQRLNELLGGVADGPFMHFALGAGWRGGKYAFEFQPENWARGESWSACQQRLEREVAAGHLAGYIVAGPEVLAGGGREVQIHTQAARDLYQTERLRRVLRLEPGWAAVEAGILIHDLNRAARAGGQQLRMWPSTERVATLGGFIAGGHSGIGSLRHGILADPGNVRRLRVVTLEERPQVLDLEGADIQKVHHAYGSNGIVVEVEVALTPAVDWQHVVVLFDGYDEVLRFGLAAAAEPALDLFQLSAVERRITPYYAGLRGRLEDRDAMFAQVAPASLPGCSWDRSSAWHSPS